MGVKPFRQVATSHGLWHTVCMNTTLKEVLTAAKAEANVSYNQLARELYELLGAYTPTPESLRRLHEGFVGKPDLIVLAALFRFYGLDRDALGEEVEQQFNHARDLLDPTSGWGFAHINHPTLFDETSEQEPALAA